MSYSRGSARLSRIERAWQQKRTELHLQALRAATAERSLREFVALAWPLVDPHPYLRTWFADAICDHLQAVTDGWLRRLVINLPPGHGKSLLCSVLWPAWVWARRPEWSLIAASYGDALAARDGGRFRQVVSSDWYATRYQRGWKPRAEVWHSGRAANTAGGERLTTSVGGKATGFRADCVLVDDPHNALEVLSATSRDEVWRWWTEVMPTRLHPETGSQVVVMQRLHEDDLSGRLLAAGGWEHLCLSAEHRPRQACSTSLGWTDPRREEGELLFPELYPETVLGELREQMGSWAFEAQLNQQPTARGGQLFREEWFRYYDQRPDQLDGWLLSWDLTFKGSGQANVEGLDWVVGDVWGWRGAARYLLDWVRGRWDLPQTLGQVVGLCERWPGYLEVGVEDAANGPAVMAMLKDRVPGLLALPARDSKLARAQTALVAYEAGQVFHPCPALDPRIAEREAELKAFPHGAHDDMVDTTAHALARIRQLAERQAWWT